MVTTLKRTGYEEKATCVEAKGVTAKPDYWAQAIKAYKMNAGIRIAINGMCRIGPPASFVGVAVWELPLWVPVDVVPEFPFGLVAVLVVLCRLMSRTDNGCESGPRTTD